MKNFTTSHKKVKIFAKVQTKIYTNNDQILRMILETDLRSKNLISSKNERSLKMRFL